MLTEWIKSVLICSIIFSVVLYIAPNPQLRRYVQMAVGFVMIIVVLNPVLRLMSSEERLTFDLLSESLGVDIEEGDDRIYTETMESIVGSYIMDSYGIKADVSISLSEQLEIDGLAVTIDYDYMRDKGVSVDESVCAAIAAALSGEYGIDESLVIIF